MRTFKQFPEGEECPICHTGEDKECVLIGLDGTQKGHNIQAKTFHLECIDLICYTNSDGRKMIAQPFE